MTFRCEDLREHGLILVPNTSSESHPASAVLHNRSSSAIVALELTWRRTAASGAEMNGSGCHWSRNILPGATESISDARIRWSASVASVVLAISAALFSSGEFVGPETSFLWQGATAEAAAWSEIGSILQGSSSDVFARIEEVTGSLTSPDGGRRPPPAPRDAQGHAFRRCAQIVAQYRRVYGEAARERLISHIANELPELRRL